MLALCGRTLRFEGTPSEVLTEENILEIYRVRSRLMRSSGGGNEKTGELRQIVPLETY